MKITHIGGSFVHNGGAEIFLRELSKHLTFRQSICVNPQFYEQDFAESFPHPVIIGGEQEISHAINQGDAIIFWGNINWKSMNLPKPKICIFNACAEMRYQVEAAHDYLTHVIACSSRTAQIVCHDVPHTVIMPGISTERLNSTQDRWAKRKQLGINDDEFLVGMVSRIGPHKRQTWLIETMRKTTDKKLKALFVGDGPLYEKLKNSAPPNCLFVGHQNDIGNWWNLLDCYCLLSENEGCPAALFEAMYCKVPVISTPVGSAIDLLNDDNAIIINNVEEIETAIERMKDSNTKKMTQLAFEQFEKHGKIKTTATRWRNLIKRLAFIKKLDEGGKEWKFLL